MNVVKSQSKAFDQFYFLYCVFAKLNASESVCFSGLLRLCLTFCLFAFWGGFRLSRQIRVLIEDSQNQVLVADIDGFADMRNKFVHLIIDGRKGGSDDFSVMSYKVG